MDAQRIELGVRDVEEPVLDVPLEVVRRDRCAPTGEKPRRGVACDRLLVRLGGAGDEALLAHVRLEAALGEPQAQVDVLEAAGRIALEAAGAFDRGPTDE